MLDELKVKKHTIGINTGYSLYLFFFSLLFYSVYFAIISTRTTEATIPTSNWESSRFNKQLWKDHTEQFPIINSRLTMFGCR